MVNGDSARKLGDGAVSEHIAKAHEFTSFKQPNVGRRRNAVERGYTHWSPKVAQDGNQTKIADHCSFHLNDESAISRYGRGVTAVFNKALPSLQRYVCRTAAQADARRLRSRKNQQHASV
jgi:hypothetical protein